MAIRIGVIGVGFGSTVHLPAFESEGLEVVAIAARRRQRAEEAASRFGVGHVFTDYEELLALPGLDAVSIATPPVFHRDMAVAALRAGKHVICEKPFALNVAEAKEMVDAAAQSGLTAMVAHEFRFCSGRMRAKELIDEGYVGQPTFALLRMLRGPAQRLAEVPAVYREARDSAASGAGLLFSLGSHFIDGLRHWFGEVAQVDGSLITASPERARAGATVMADADDTFFCRLKFASGVVIDVACSRAAMFASDCTITVYGSEGVLETPQDGFNPPAHGVVLGAQASSGSAPVQLEIPARLEPFSDDRDNRLMPFRLLVREFCRGVQEGYSPAPSFLDGYRCQEVLDAIRRSSATGERVEVGGAPLIPATSASSA
jgi:predicted dehydrogenase